MEGSSNLQSLLKSDEELVWLLQMGFDIDTLEQMDSEMVIDILEQLREQHRRRPPIAPKRPKEQPPDYCENKSVIMANSLCGEERTRNRCGYCNNKRDTERNEDGSLQEGLLSHEIFFTSTKMRVDDYERIHHLGFTRSGNYFYRRNIQKNCCDVYQYKVDINQFQPNSQQRKAMK
jgi:hypothetical protein